MNRRKFLKVSGVMLGGLAVTSMGVDMLGITTKKIITCKETMLQ